ncbi:hypothetical protein [Nonomuraea basaltis]|uniref:hypothetical protein n=1 Tax=Nonomuraea basaltis TaxID=2495887 RepID=UPI00110C5657|nr:hypothetical protein [Nonomuraea basaltis]TMS00214.1 hypothetical protein EJK15_03825 [Nonomuraea basaltis]
MNTIVTVAVWLLAAFALIQASIVDLPDDDQDTAEPRPLKWWHPFYWLGAVAVAFPLYTLWNAGRFAVYVAAFVVACLSVHLATASALDGRALRVYRTPVWLREEVSS